MRESQTHREEEIEIEIESESESESETQSETQNETQSEIERDTESDTETERSRQRDGETDLIPMLETPPSPYNTQFCFVSQRPFHCLKHGPSTWSQFTELYITAKPGCSI